MNHARWLVGHRFQRLTRRDYDWLISFDRGASLVVSCLWRLIESGRIRFTSEDDGQQFGLPKPVDVAAEVQSRIDGAMVEAVGLREGLLDLDIRFSTEHVLQLIPTSAGYEAWILSSGNRQVIAVGGGELVEADG
jgi:hypothetical protein